ncbi:TetR/AcrR family transcriptional regulator [Nocardia blacklockiae]|uniref:TetR/AcrR family transcriptional regulator n=1 Tax=Nocardia blacklockiae TaxID=480036 RepID=UPI0018944B4A|nr:TetR/AcrR family transcriptional regulator [Nocardia blacklockiae]MBF6175794.1 TetR/AcrR family transcriptional regulator [Nocardia blacklockiae]
MPAHSAGPARRRGAVLEEAILQAALDELRETGYAGLTMDRVAARAGTNKSAIYRRWPHRAELAVAAYRRVAVTEELPDTGDLRADVLALLRGAAAHIAAHHGDVLHILASEIRAEPGLLREVREQLLDASVTRWLTVLSRAVARGQARAEALSPRVATLAIDLLRHEYLVRGVTTVPESTLTEIVDTIYLPLVAAPTEPTGT